ncbi:PAS domain-containing sensor histidine kinase [Bradyrhizobium manausense]|uniref:histidine kinase n=1 Tax=Bradyrhizobium manausense TaxID=989370 RepID=A0A0R3E9I5_9BRAD|nr:PAS domain-containing protein [Bradyrhizobium manausense]KRQ17182.1 histidine kinase [Bradyrhizobium manausense]
MTNSDFQLRGVGDPRLSVHATSPLPAWLWSLDGCRVLWANPVGAKFFGAANAAALAQKTFGPADSHRRQIVRLAHRLPAGGAVRLERLRGFGAGLGTLMTCACARLEFSDGSSGVLVSAMQGACRSMPLVERLHRLVDGARTPMAAFAPDGLFAGASEAARSLLGFRDLGEAGLDQARSEALAKGRAELPVGIGKMVLQRVGVGADVGLIALIEPAMAQAQPAAERAPPPAAEPAPPVASAPAHGLDAGIAMFDPFAEPDETPVTTGHEATNIVSIQDSMKAAAAAPETLAQTADAAPETVVENLPEAIVPPQAAPITSAMVEPPRHAETQSAHVEPPSGHAETRSAHAETRSAHGETPRQHPLRFLWQMDAQGRFVLGSDEFIRLIGAHTASRFGRPWREIAEEFALDPDGRVAQALASHDTWAGITVNWPADGGEHLPVELAGLPVYDRARNFAGFKGFGVCRDLDALNRLDALRRFELFAAQGLSADLVEPQSQPGSQPRPEPEHKAEAKPEAEPPPSEPPPEPEPPTATEPEPPAPITEANSHPTEPETPVETPPNVVPFRAPGDQRSQGDQKSLGDQRSQGDQRSPTLTPVENSAFNELARQLSERLEREREQMASASAEPPADAITPDGATPPEPLISEPPISELETPPAAAEWLSEPAPPAYGHSARDRALLDLIPSGILIYRLDRLLYANSAFLDRIGYASLGALEDAGGLDALYVEPGVSAASSTSQSGTPVTISATVANGAQKLATTEAHLHTIDWDGASAHALICALPNPEPVVATPVATPVIVAPVAAPQMAAETEVDEPVLFAPEPDVGDADAEDLAAILDTTAEGIVMFDADGNIHACNRSAEALFGYDGEALMQQNLLALFAPESQQIVLDYLDSLKSQNIASLLDHGREVLGREKKGGVLPLAMIMGRTRPDGPNFFAVFRDLSQAKKGESELTQARRLVDGAANAKADMLARISHEIRTPLNAIIGFAEVMISERFGSLGNERYGEYMKDIRASGERVITIIDDLLELSRIETGKLDLSFADLNLNDLVEACVTVMQPQANRERIIIRSSLGHALPQVAADPRALRQVTMNLISNSIRLASAGGQVIVSTALNDRGEVALRIRDTGHGLSDREVAAAMEPFRTPPPGDAADNSALSLSLTKALVEANHARFNIKSAGQGTLIEVTFAPVTARA